MAGCFERSTMADKWHPILSTREVEPGVWQLVDNLGVIYAIVTLVKRGDQRGYRSESYAPERADRRLIGYYTRLLPAVKSAHMWFVASRGPTGIPAAGYAGRGWDSTERRESPGR
jgi:hypothetical protein